MAKRVYIAELDAHTARLETKINNIQNRTITAGARMEKAFMRVGGAMIAAFSAQQVLSFMDSSIEAYKKQELAIQRLNTAFGKNSISLQKYAKDLQKVTIFSDEATMEAMSLIAAFTKKEDQIKGLLEAAQNYASAKGIDLVTATDLISKSFNLTVMTVRALGIEVMGAGGSVERYISLMKALSVYQRQAAEQGKTLTGQLEIQKNKLNDVQEEIGRNLLPTWLELNKAFANTIELLFASEAESGASSMLGVLQFLTGKTPSVKGKSAADMMFEFVGNVKESIPWLKQQQDRLKEIGALIKAGNLNQIEYTKLKKEEDKIQKSLTVEKEKEVKLEATRIIQYKTAQELFKSLQDKMGGKTETERDRRMREGPGESRFGAAGGKRGPASQMTEASKALEEAGLTTEEMVNNFSSIVGASQNISNILGIGAHTFVAVLLNGLSQATSIVGSILSIIASVISFSNPVGMAIGALEKGGRVTNLGGNISFTKIPSFAVGGSYSTPAFNGPFSGGYPVMVHKNETLDVYNAGQTSRLEGKLDGIKNAIITSNIHLSKRGKGGSGVTNIYIDGKKIMTSVESHRNRAARSNKNLGEII